MRRKRDNARKNCNGLYKKLRNQCVTLGRKETQQANDQRMNKNPSEVWKILKETTGQLTKDPVKLKDGSRALEYQESASAFNDFFLGKVEKIKNDIGEGGSDPLNSTRQRASNLGLKKSAFSLKTVNAKQVLKAIKKSKKSSCPDIDGVSPEMLKLAGPVIAEPLSWVINSTIVSQKVPSVWKQARIIPLHKKKEKFLASNYRPISILPTCSKIMEEIVRSQLSKYCNTMGIIPPSQHGFQAGKSTITALGAVTHDWKASRQSGLEVGCLLFDLSAAFDLIDVDILAAKLEIYGCDAKTIAWLRDYLTGRWQLVEYGGQRSEIKAVKIGSPQGSILSPLLFIILTSDMGEAVSDGTIITYADDTTVYIAHKEREAVYTGLEKAADEILQYMKSNSLAANAEKTKFMMFGRKKGGSIRVGQAIVEESEAEPLLGVKINKNLSWTTQVEELKVELSKRVGIIRRLAQQLPRHTMLKVITPLFTSKLQYAIEIFTDPSSVVCGGRPKDSSLQGLQVLHNKAMRAALGKTSRDRSTTEELLALTGQPRVLETSLRAVIRAAKTHLGENEDKSVMVSGRIRHSQTTRVTRNQEQGLLPSQDSSNTLVSTMATVWNYVPDKIKKEENPGKCKQEIKKFCALSLRSSLKE